MPRSEGPLIAAFRALQRGRISRREFITQAAALGASIPVIMAALNSLGASDSMAQEENPGRPSIGTDGQVRGAGGELKLLQWLGPASLNSHVSDLGQPGLLAAALVLEPLLSFAPDGSLLPNLVTEVPTLENGGLSDDLTTITYHLIPGLLWSDGEPVTAEDVRWSWQWIMDETNVATFVDTYRPIESVEVKSPTAVTIIFKEGSLDWFKPFTGSYSGVLLPKHIWDGQDKDTVNQQFLTNPIGTGPFKVESFDVGHQVTYSMNDRYREPNKPYFDTVILQSGGDPATAAQAVLQDGQADLAWNILGDAGVLQSLEANGKGTVGTVLSAAVEHILFNFADPNKEVDGERSSLKALHPFLTDPLVRKAMALAIDRDAISNFYLGGDREPVAVNILTGIGALESPNTVYEFDIDLANQLLDEAGWTRTGEVRSKDGIRLSLAFNTTNRVQRKRTQQLVKKGWEAIGIEVTLNQLDPVDFFDTEDEEYFFKLFYCDVEMFTNNPTSPMPFDYMLNWYAGPANENVAQQANEWQGYNIQRYVNPRYDALLEEATATHDASRAAELFIQMNDLLVNEHVIVPLVARSNEVFAISNRLEKANIGASTWEPLYWNIANWRTV